MSTAIESSVLETPELHHREKHDTSLEDSSIDEKFPDEKEGAHHIAQPVDTADLGDVYEDVRAIDLDTNGKEKPISMSALMHDFSHS